MNIDAMSDQARLNEARALAVTLDRLVRHPKRISPTAPWIIPATMIVVAAFALICIVIKLIMNYLQSKNGRSKDLDRPHTSSPDLPSTPEDQTSMATTASMRTRKSIRMTSNRHYKNNLPPVSLYQLKQRQSPGSSSKSKTHKAAMKALSRAARAEANRSMSRDSSRQQDDATDDNSNRDNNSPNLSRRSDDTDEMQTANQPGLAYGVASPRGEHHSETGGPGFSGNQPEAHIVQIRDLEDTHLRQPTWPQTESEI